MQFDHHQEFSYPQAPASAALRSHSCSEVVSMEWQSSHRSQPKPSDSQDSTVDSTRASLFPRRKAGQHDFKAKRGRPALVLDRACIESLLHLPLSEAADEVGICVTSLKRACRKVGLQRWPYVRRFNHCSPSSPGFTRAKDDEMLSGEDTASDSYSTVSSPCRSPVIRAASPLNKGVVVKEISSIQEEPSSLSRLEPEDRPIAKRSWPSSAACDDKEQVSGANFADSFHPHFNPQAPKANPRTTFHAPTAWKSSVRDRAALQHCEPSSCLDANPQAHYVPVEPMEVTEQARQPAICMEYMQLNDTVEDLLVLKPIQHEFLDWFLEEAEDVQG